MRFNPAMEGEIPWEQFTAEEMEVAKRLEETLLRGDLPDFVPPYNQRWSPLRSVCTAFRMWAYINQEFCQNLARAMESEFGPNATYLEIMAGMGWLAKGLIEADLKGIYIATDYKPPNDAVFPVSKIDAVEAVKKHRNDIDAFVVSWPPYEDPVIDLCLEQIPRGKKIIYIGEGSGGCCGTDKFFRRAKLAESLNPELWETAEYSLFQWSGFHDYLSLFKVI